MGYRDCYMSTNRPQQYVSFEAYQQLRESPNTEDHSSLSQAVKQQSSPSWGRHIVMAILRIIGQ